MRQKKKNNIESWRERERERERACKWKFLKLTCFILNCFFFPRRRKWKIKKMKTKLEKKRNEDLGEKMGVWMDARKWKGMQEYLYTTRITNNPKIFQIPTGIFLPFFLIYMYIDIHSTPHSSGTILYHAFLFLTINFVKSNYLL